jgi:hypothetical protein
MRDLLQNTFSSLNTRGEPSVTTFILRLILISLCVSLGHQSYAQTATLVTPDSLARYVEIVDSVSTQASASYFALKSQYDSIEFKYNTLTSALQSKADSLSRDNMLLTKVLEKRDSIDQLKEMKLSALSKKVEALKSRTISKIVDLNLPPQLKSKVDDYTNAVSNLDLSIPSPVDFQLPSLTTNRSLDLPIPNLHNPFGESIPNLSGPNLPVVDEISKATSQLQGLNESRILKDIPTVDQLGEMAETHVAQIKDVSAAQDQLGKLTPAIPTSEEQAKQELLNLAKESAVDHFAGKGQELKSAMDQISKYKKKFHNVNNLEELAQLIKKRPNEMRGKPFIERVVPGIAFQLQKKNDLLFTDFNPYFGYKFTGRLTAGIGWNQRVSYNLNDNAFENDSRIFGPRAYTEYKLWRGFSPRLEVETMNTFVPPYIKVSPADVGQREWVWGVFVGMKKDYKFWKKINGTAQVMFRLFDPHRKSPYADVVNARFGFEIPMKKKPAKRNI